MDCYEDCSRPARKGGAYIQTEMKGVLDGTKLNERFRSSGEIERVFLDEKPYQFLYAEGDSLVFMDQESFEQVYLNKDVLGDSLAFLQDGMVVTLSFYEGKVLSAELPATIIATVEQADPVVKGKLPVHLTNRLYLIMELRLWCRNILTQACALSLIPPMVVTLRERKSSHYVRRFEPVFSRGQCDGYGCPEGSQEFGA